MAITIAADSSECLHRVEASKVDIDADALEIHVVYVDDPTRNEQFEKVPGGWFAALPHWSERGG